MSRQLLTPSPSPSPPPPPPAPTPTLPAQINAATRKQHTELNRLIIDRLPLALPPKASSPLLLGQGLSAFAAIFFLFEDCWKELYDAVEASDTSLTGTHDAQVYRWLATLIPPELLRSARLKQDLEFISDRTGAKLESSFLRASMGFDRLTDNIRARPHTLLAYGWVMYMAVFSGGRFIRQQFSSAGGEFWTGDDALTELDQGKLQSLDLPGFSFLSFDSDEDGEDIKALFKGRLAEAETLLTQQERQDVIDTAQQLFTKCIELVDMLDMNIWWQDNWTTMLILLLSIAVAVWAVIHYW